MSKTVLLPPERFRSVFGAEITKGSEVVISPLIPFSNDRNYSYLVVAKVRADTHYAQLIEAFGVNNVEMVAFSFPMTTSDSASIQYWVDVFVLRTSLTQIEIERKINEEVLS